MGYSEPSCSVRVVWISFYQYWRAWRSHVCSKRDVHLVIRERYWFIGLALFVQGSGYRLYLEKDPLDMAALFIPQSPLQSKGDRIINKLRCEALQWRRARINEADRLLANIHKCTWLNLCVPHYQIFWNRLLRNVEQISITSLNPAVRTGRKYRKHVTLKHLSRSN